MKVRNIALSLATVAAMSAGSAMAADPVRLGDCGDFADDYVATAEAKARFAGLKGACEGVYDIDGVKYARAEMLVRSNRMSTLHLYLPATDNTISVKPDPTRRVYINGRKKFVSDLEAGDEIELYIEVDKFFTPAPIDAVAFAAADEAEEEIHVHEAAAVAALPTTASPIPALALLSGLFVAAGAALRLVRRKA